MAIVVLLHEQQAAAAEHWQTCELPHEEQAAAPLDAVAAREEEHRLRKGWSMSRSRLRSTPWPRVRKSIACRRAEEHGLQA